MRYWQHSETGRLLRIDLQMAPIHWIEITKEQYEEGEKINQGVVDEKNDV